MYIFCVYSTKSPSSDVVNRWCQLNSKAHFLHFSGAIQLNGKGQNEMSDGWGHRAMTDVLICQREIVIVTTLAGGDDSSEFSGEFNVQLELCGSSAKMYAAYE
ncbi:hypothetical protein AB6A40_002956 [Gnathostoma spinigerum]|uniref:Uncharacterized protein n=1 Tax=Gnathostoma spinigerum TaxID=75299 RepID=A0ABD6EHU0_9BILA